VDFIFAAIFEVFLIGVPPDGHPLTIIAPLGTTGDLLMIHIRLPGQFA